MLRKFRGTLIIWIIALGLLLLNMITSLSFSTEIVFALVNLIVITVAVTIVVKRITNL